MTKLRLPIPPGARVLEIGSGHNPHPRSDLLCDRHLEDVERGGPLRLDRPFVQADGAALPFRDRVIGYVIAVHVAEHVDDLGVFFDELVRVADGGYIESPSPVSEMLFGWGHHRWQIAVVDGALRAHRVPQARRAFGGLFHELMRRDPQMTALYYRYPGVFLTRFHWRGSIAYQIVDADQTLVNLDDPAVIDELLAQRAGMPHWLRAYVPRRLRDPIWRLARNALAKRRARGSVPD